MSVSCSPVAEPLHTVRDSLREQAVRDWLRGQKGIAFMFPSETQNVSNGKTWGELAPSIVNGSDAKTSKPCSPIEALETYPAFREGRAPLFYGGTMIWCEKTERGYKIRQEPNTDFIRVVLGELKEAEFIDTDIIRTTAVGKDAALAGYPETSSMTYHGERTLEFNMSQGPKTCTVFARTPIGGRPWTENVEDQVVFLLAMDLGEYVVPGVELKLADEEVTKTVELLVVPAKQQTCSGAILTIVPSIEWIGVEDMPQFLDSFRRVCQKAYGDKVKYWSVNPVDRRSKHHFHGHGMVMPSGKISPIFGEDGVSGLMGAIPGVPATEAFP